MIIFLLIGILFAGIGCAIIYGDFQSKRKAHTVTGQVIGYTFQKRLQTRNQNFRSVVQFAHPRSGTYYVVSSMGSNTPLHHMGEKVKVRTNDSEPVEATIQSKAFLIMGGVFVCMGLGLATIFFKTFSWDIPSVASSVIMLAIVVGSIWKKGRANKDKLSDMKAKILSEPMIKNQVYSEQEFSKIDFITPEEVHSADAKGMKATRISMIVCLLIGLGLGVLCLKVLDRDLKFFAAAVKTDGRVVEMVSRHGKSTSYVPVIEFTPKTQTDTIRFQHSVGTNPPMYSVGEAVTVLYAPEFPNDARLDTGIWNFKFPFFSGLGSVLFFFFFIHSYLYMQKRKPVAGRSMNHPHFPSKSA
jgi:hypothetical protein